MSFKIKENITWVGKIDWELRKFHGEEYSTHRGSSYNSYLVQDEKTALIDTVWGKFSGEFVENLKKKIPLEKIDFVIANHAESDHSGALPELMRHIPDMPDILHEQWREFAERSLPSGLEFSSCEDRG